MLAWTFTILLIATSRGCKQIVRGKVKLILSFQIYLVHYQEHPSHKVSAHFHGPPSETSFSVCQRRPDPPHRRSNADKQCQNVVLQMWTSPKATTFDQGPRLFERREKLQFSETGFWTRDLALVFRTPRATSKLKIVCKQNKLDHLSIINWFAETKNKLTYDLLIILAYNLFILFYYIKILMWALLKSYSKSSKLLKFANSFRAWKRFNWFCRISMNCWQNQARNKTILRLKIWCKVRCFANLKELGDPKSAEETFLWTLLCNILAAPFPASLLRRPRWPRKASCRGQTTWGCLSEAKRDNVVPTTKAWYVLKEMNRLKVNWPWCNFTRNYLILYVKSWITG